MQCRTFTFSFRMCSASRLTCMHSIEQSIPHCFSHTPLMQDTIVLLSTYHYL